MLHKVTNFYFLGKLNTRYQSGVIIIPKSVRKERMAENLEIINHKLSKEDMELISKLDLGHSLFFDHHDGEVAKMFMGWRGLV